MKICSKCNERKKESDFYHNHDDCKKCWNAYCSERRKVEKEKDPEFLEKRNIYLRQWRENNKEKIKEYTKKSLEKNKDLINKRRRTPEKRKILLEGVKNWRKNNPERFAETESIRRKKDRKKENARNLVWKHVLKGKIVQSLKCEVCMKKRITEAHHDDYDKPLEVRWLCKICHKHEHGKLLDLKP